MPTPRGQLDLAGSLKSGGPHLLAVGASWLLTFFLGLWIPEIKENAATFQTSVAAVAIGGYAVISPVFQGD